MHFFFCLPDWMQCHQTASSLQPPQKQVHASHTCSTVPQSVPCSVTCSLPGEPTRQSSSGKESGSRKEEWWKGKNETRRHRGCLTHHRHSCRIFAYPYSVSCAVSLPSCTKNELPNASQPKKLWVPVFKREQRATVPLLTAG